MRRRAALEIGDAALEGHQHSLGAIADIELSQNAIDVKFYGAFANYQRSGNLLVRLALGEQ